MPPQEQPVPIVMSFSANDPSGAGGIQADIETLGSLGCHCAPVMTTVTAQDTTDLYQFYACPSRLVRDQAKAVLEDMPIACIKIGLLGSIENARAVHQILKDYPDIPVVLDPILHVGAKSQLVDPALLDAMIALILPHVTVCAPNASEAKMMAPEADTLDACAQEIMAHGAQYVLITGGLTATKVVNTFYGNYRRLETFQWDRLDINPKGAGCTLTASLAALLAQGLPAASAVQSAQEFTADCLNHAFRIGMGLQLTNRLFWARGNDYDYDATTNENKKRG